MTSGVGEFYAGQLVLKGGCILKVKCQIGHFRFQIRVYLLASGAVLVTPALSF